MNTVYIYVTLFNKAAKTRKAKALFSGSNNRRGTRFLSSITNMFSLKPLIALSLAVCVASTGARDANTEFKIKFKKTNTQGTLNAKMPGDEALSPTDQLREWHRRSGTSGNNDGGGTPTEKDDELSYRVMQTIKGSYAAIGPLQCESTCQVKRGRPNCHVDTLDCALGCAERCEQGTNEVELKEKLCIEGCTLFCGVHPTTNAGGFAQGIHKVQ